MKGYVGCIIAFFAFGLTIGALAFGYCVEVIFGRALPWWANVIGGIVGGEVTLPLAIVLWLLSLVGVHGPFIK